MPFDPCSKNVLFLRYLLILKAYYKIWIYLGLYDRDHSKNEYWVWESDGSKANIKNKMISSVTSTTITPPAVVTTARGTTTTVVPTARGAGPRIGK